MKKEKIIYPIDDISIPNHFGEFVMLLIPSLVCNFNCEYCYLNEFERKPLTQFQKDKLIEFIHKVEELTQNKKGRILDLSGGEFFRFCDFDNFMNEFYNNWNKIRLFTNLDYPFDFLQKFKNYPNFIIIPSIHFHQIKDWNEYLKKLDLVISFGNLVFIKLLYEEDYQDKIQEIINKYNNIKNVRVLIKPLFSKKSNYDKLLKKYPNIDVKIIFKKKEFYLRQFLENTQFNFKNVECKAGNNDLAVDWNGNVFPCESLLYDNPKYKIMNIYKDNIEDLKLKPMYICPGNLCKSEWWLK